MIMNQKLSKEQAYDHIMQAGFDDIKVTTLDQQTRYSQSGLISDCIYESSSHKTRSLTRAQFMKIASDDFWLIGSTT